VHVFDRALKWLFFRAVRKPWRWPDGPEREEDWERVQVRVEGGRWARAPYHVAALWRPAEGVAKGTVVMAHHLWPRAKGYFLTYGHARMLRNAGYHVLVFDFNGFGESPSVGFDYDEEVCAAGQEAARRAPGLPVGLLAQCFGAGWGAMKAIAELDHPFQALVAVSPYASVQEYFTARLGEWDTSRERWLRQRVPRAAFSVGLMLHPAARRAYRTPIEHAARARGVRAVLLIFGGDDLMAPPAVGRQYLAAMRQARAERGEEAAEPELWVIPGGRHPHVHAAAPEAFRDRVVGFFNRELARGGGAVEP
jgi:pimeloyl-ACP methyl ester carboxylesterase